MIPSNPLMIETRKFHIIQSFYDILFNIFFVSSISLNVTIDMVDSVKLFGKWSLEDVEVSDLALVDFIGVKGKHANYVAHTAGRYQRKCFRKAMQHSSKQQHVKRLCGN